MSEKLSDWFEPSVKPEIVGVYQTNAPVPYQAYQYWDGKQWGCYCSTPTHAYTDGAEPSYHQNARWRGLSENPEA